MKLNLLSIVDRYFYVAEDELEALTPNHLTFGRDISKSSKLLKKPYFPSAQDLQKRVRYLHTLSNQFWKRFYRSYLNELRQKSSYHKRNNNDPHLRIGDVLLIKDDVPTPRLQWKLGKVVKVISGRDGNIRGAQLKTVFKSGQQTLIYRPVQKLIHLEIPNNRIENSLAVPDVTDMTSEHTTEARKTRKAAIEGQNLRRLREHYMC